MSAIDTAKEIAKIAVTSGLSTEIIGLLEKKVTLLTEQVTTLETENKNLKAKLYDLEKELDRLKPKQDLADEAVKALRLFFDGDRTVTQVSQYFGMTHGMAEYHCGVLEQHGMIQFPMAIMIGGETELCITQKGREYLVNRGLV
jgi:FtsZ-binding cell division protein ZapB